MLGYDLIGVVCAYGLWWIGED